MTTIIRMYNDFLDQAYDDRIEHYPLMGSFYKIIGVAMIYLLFVKVIGPKFMEKRKPFQLNQAMFVYNALQVICNLGLSLTGLYMLYKDKDFDSACPIVDFSRTPRGYLGLRLAYMFYLLKILDLMDTIFITLRKRYRQASVLHIYHHTVMVIGTYANIQYYPGGSYMVSGTLNCLVHVVMYSYFCLTAIRPELKNSIWWKKHITQIQMLQFCFNMYLYSRILLQENCGYSMGWTVFGLVQNVLFFFMFLNFYIRNYIFSKISKKTE